MKLRQYKRWCRRCEKHFLSLFKKGMICDDCNIKFINSGKKTHTCPLCESRISRNVYFKKVKKKK